MRRATKEPLITSKKITLDLQDSTFSHLHIARPSSIIYYMQSQLRLDSMP